MLRHGLDNLGLAIAYDIGPSRCVISFENEAARTGQARHGARGRAVGEALGTSDHQDTRGTDCEGRRVKARWDAEHKTCDALDMSARQLGDVAWHLRRDMRGSDAEVIEQLEQALGGRAVSHGHDCRGSCA
jgi:hypothetical protein